MAFAERAPFSTKNDHRAGIKMSTWLDQYLDGWTQHIAGDQQAMEKVAEATTEDFRLEELNAAAVGYPPFSGSEGVRAIFTRVDDLADSRFEVVSKMVSGDGTRWAIEFVWSGTRRSNGKPWSVRGAAAGTLAPDGKVASAYEYWNPVLLQMQVGALPAAFGEVMEKINKPV